MTHIIYGLLGLSSSSITLLAGLNDPIFTIIRTLTLVSSSFTEPASQQQRLLVLSIPVSALQGIRIGDERPFGPPSLQQD